MATGEPVPFEQWLAGRDERVVNSLLSIMAGTAKPTPPRRPLPEHLDHGGDINRYLEMKGEL